MKKGTLKKVLKYAGKYRLLILLSMVLAIVTALLSLYVPILAGNAIDCIVGAGAVDFGKITTILIRMVIAIAIIAVCQWIMNQTNNKITFQVVRDVRKEAFDKLQILPFEYIDSKQTGDIVSRIISDVDLFADGLLMGFTQLFTGIVTIVGTLVFMFYLNYRIAIVVVVLTPLSLFIAKFIADKSFKLFKEQSQSRADQTAFVDEMIGNLSVVKAFAHEDENMEVFDEVNERLRKTSIMATFISSLTNPSTRCVNNLVYAAVALFGAFACIAGGMTVGGLTIFLSYANQYTKPFNEISGVVTELQNALACAERVFAIIEEKPEVSDDANAPMNFLPEGEVTFSDVAFSYDKSKELIGDLDLNVKKGQRVAIVGPTGSGKTTLINLLMRFYDVDNGSISIDGHDIRTLKRKDLRDSFGMVLQETWLRSGTIRDNITLGREGFTDEQIIEAAKASHAHSFIKRLPEGYDTVITENGGNLSQGQKQLLCITRVMLNIPPMLILDEATSSIDTSTEIRIQKAFNKMMKGRTSFIVAHRLSTIREADVILVMKDGHILEQGNHEQLLEKKGFYYELYNSQFA
ncbi:ABC transporter ATP-binding protein/permease [Butyrivibrio sp. DSM 10294]|uniref:ABC transporter ATP-binding protein n=1 Tax=Butyrivibrio sp. DSM 10294 TaxID=2972457 RepID=UPI00234E8E97|nr:ABC transporter ATP-binding protein [Butyrivibrio sp. DSM 10294]MDC7293990.1 ABC transporter ATP-binding protein/permease [Butyrivibrio sp. DSM 10294]